MLLHKSSIRPIVGTTSHHQVSPGDSSDDPYVRISVELRQSTLVWLDDLRKEWGLHSRGDLVSRLLDELAKPTSNE